LTLLVGVLDFTGVVAFWHLLAIGVANGSMMALSMPSRQAILSEIVPDSGLMNAISLNNSAMNLTRIIGPALAGFLIVIIDTSGVFFIVSAIYLFSAAATTMVKAGTAPAAASRKGMVGEIKAGFVYAASNRAMLGVIILMLLSSLFGFSYFALMPAWAREALDVQSDGLGILMTIMGVGALAGTLGLAAVPNVKRRGLVLLASCLIWGVALAAFSQVTSYAAAVPFLLVIGMVGAVFMSLNMTMMQVLAPPEMRGRIMAISMMTFGVMALSALPFGALAEATGSTADSLFISGVLLAVATLIFWVASPAFRRLR
jgi:MFS family permease